MRGSEIQPRIITLEITRREPQSGSDSGAPGPPYLLEVPRTLLDVGDVVLAGTGRADQPAERLRLRDDVLPGDNVLIAAQESDPGLVQEVAALPSVPGTVVVRVAVRRADNDSLTEVPHVYRVSDVRLELRDIRHQHHAWDKQRRVRGYAFVSERGTLTY